VDPSSAIRFYSTINGLGPALYLNAPAGDYFYSAATLGPLFIQSGTATLVGSTTLTATQEYIGDSVGGANSTAAFAQSTGYNRLNDGANQLFLGYNTTDFGLYSLSASGLLYNPLGADLIGYGGTGIFNQTGGTNIVSNLDIAALPGSTGSYLLTNTSSLVAQTMHVGGITSAAGGRGVITVTNSASLAVSGLLKIWNYGRVNLDIPATTIGSLNITGNGLLNLNGALQINFASPANDPVATIVSYLKSGYNNGNFNGTSGIISTSVAGTSPAVAIGYADGNTDPGTAAGPNQLLVQYTLNGDSNLDGLVNFNDLVAVVQNFNKPNTDWSHGDFHFGTSTNFNDLVAVVQNFNKILPPPSASAEPGSLCLFGATALTLLKRRRANFSRF
jgi:hypothetical protein